MHVTTDAGLNSYVITEARSLLLIEHILASDPYYHFVFIIIKVLYLLNKLDIINSPSQLLLTSTKSVITGLDGVKYVTEV